MSDNGATEGSRPGLNLSKMIRLDQVEDIMNSMMHRLDRQEATIVQLQNLCSSLLTKNAANEQFEEIQDTMRDMTERMEQLNTASTSNIGQGRVIPAGELAYMNHINLQKLSQQVATCARTTDVESKLQELSNTTEDGLLKVRTQSTPAELGESMRRSQIDMSTRITTSEALLSQKVDRSEVGQLTNLAVELESYSQFRIDTESTLRGQSEWNDNTSSIIATHKIDIDKATEDRNCIKNELSLKATIDGLEEVAAALRSVTGMTNLCAAKKTVNELYEIVRGEQLRASNNENVISSLKSQAMAADQIIATKASIEDNKKNVLRKHYDEAITALGNDLDTKATQKRLITTDNRVAILEAELEVAKNRLAVAMRFVEWFTTRGENYEHNLKLVDKHLGKLANAADPKERSPYTGQVRFTGNSMSDPPPHTSFGGNTAANAINTALPTSNIGTSFSHLI
jgi:hypothetical protein